MIGDCRLPIGGLSIVDCRSTDRRLNIGLVPIAQVRIGCQSTIINPPIVDSTIANPSIGNRQSATGN
jgi:hypothetical protein